MLLRDIAHSRTGDKGNRSTISVIAYDIKHYPLIERCVTAERLRVHYRDIARGKVELKTEIVEMADVVAKAIEMASPLLEQRTHTLTVAMRPRTESVTGTVVYTEVPSGSSASEASSSRLPRPCWAGATVSTRISNSSGCWLRPQNSSGWRRLAVGSKSRLRMACPIAGR